MTFSQGTLLASSALLLHEAETPHLPPPFKAAVFICGGPSLDTLQSLGFTISQAAWDRRSTTRKQLEEQANTSAILRSGANRWTGTAEPAISVEEARREIHGPYQISVPTVHIYGSNDPMYIPGITLSGLCDENKRKAYNHGGGHEIPRKTDVTEQIAGMVRWALVEADVVTAK